MVQNLIRPDSIVYLVLSAILNYQDNPEELQYLIGNSKDWSNGQNVIPYMIKLVKIINKVLSMQLNREIIEVSRTLFGYFRLE